MVCEDGTTPQLVAYVVPESQSSTDEQDRVSDNCRKALKCHLPDYMIPDVFVLLEAMPLTPNGKIDRQRLPAPDSAKAPGHQYIAPRTDTEQRLCQIWQEVLGISVIGIHDNFFEVGGNSLLLVRVATAVMDEFGIEIGLLQSFSSPTIEALAAMIDERQTLNDLVDRLKSGAGSSVESNELVL